MSDPKIGDTVSHYKILEPLGRGGMGVVYKAKDERLDRVVALKFISSHDPDQDDQAGQRFIQEAKAASALEHPNICTIYEIEEGDDGRQFIAMAFYRGQTLEQVIERGPVEVSRALDLAIQICDGLAAAHAQGIVHRDIKPGNVVLTESGIVKILDFGLAKLVGDERLTQTGVAVGTLESIAPETLQGAEPDHRVDIWALGVLLYSLISGDHPFHANSSAALISSILHDDPLEAMTADGALPPELLEILRTALQKQPDARYASIGAMQQDLARLRSSLDSGPSSDSAPAPSVAVLPFANLSPDPDNEYFSDGLAEELINVLSRSGGLKVAARTSAFRFRDRQLDVREIGRKLQVGHVLEGSVRKSGNRLRVTIQLVSAANGYQLWAERFDRELRDVFEVQDEIALAVADKLRSRLLDPERAALVRKHTANPEAFDQLLRGRFHLNKRTAADLDKALGYFKQAIDLEQDYAPAHAAVAETYNLLSRYGVMEPDASIPLAKAAAERALNSDPNLAEAHTAHAYALHRYYWQWQQAEAGYQRALELNPSYATGHHFYGWFLAGQDRLTEALDQINTAIQNDPLSLISNTSFGSFLLFARRYSEAEAQLRKTLDMEPDFAVAHQWLGRVQLYSGDAQAAVASFERVIETIGEDAETLASLGQAAAIAGDADRARQILEKLREMQAARYVSHYWFGLLHLGLGELDRALDWFVRSIEERSDWIVDLKVDPAFDALRALPGYQDLLQRMNIA